MFLHTSHPAIQFVFFGKQSLDFALWWRTALECGEYPFFLWKDSSGFGILAWLDVVAAQLLLQSWLWQSLCDFCSASLGALLCVPEAGIRAGANPTGMVLGIRNPPLSLCLTDAACSLHSQGTLMFKAQKPLDLSLPWNICWLVVFLKNGCVKNWLITPQARFLN